MWLRQVSGGNISGKTDFAAPTIILGKALGEM